MSENDALHEQKAPYPGPAQSRQKTFPTVEIFGPTIQGEGAVIGRPTIFVRLGGCDYRCLWCDTLYAVDKAFKDTWEYLTEDQIVARVEQLTDSRSCMVTLSGGNPAIHPLRNLVALLHERGYTVMAETQGSIPAPWLADLDLLVLSPKPPSSGMETRWSRLLATAKLLPADKTSLKVVVSNEEDYQFARKVAHLLPAVQLYLQPCNPHPGEAGSSAAQDALGLLSALIERVLADKWLDVIVLPQLHVLLWGNSPGK